MTQFKLVLALAALTAAPAAFAQEPAAAQMATPATAPVTAEVGKMLYSNGGKQLAAVYRVGTGGSPQILLDGKLITVPAATLTSANGRLETSLSRRDLMTMR